jgi:hypothetical protein
MEKGHEIWYKECEEPAQAASLTTVVRELVRNTLDVVGVKEVRWDKG